MKISKFFKFTIEGDELNIDEIEKIGLPAKIFRKGETYRTTYTNSAIKQRTNRWMFYVEQIDDKSISKFLTLSLKSLIKHLDELKPFIRKYKSKAEIVLYADNKTDICLTKEQLALLKKLETKFYISFC